MAFKRFDFSTLDTNHPAEPRSPYAICDREDFADKNRQPRKIHRGTVDILLDEQRSTMLGDLQIKAQVEKNGQAQAVTLLFKGQRADDLRAGRLMADYQSEHEARCDAGDWDSQIIKTLIVEGAWVPRNWKDRAGKWHKSWELIVAKWHYSPAGEEGFVVEGHDPVLD